MCEIENPTPNPIRMDWTPFGPDDETGDLLQLMYEQSVDRAHRRRYDSARSDGFVQLMYEQSAEQDDINRIEG